MAKDKAGGLGLLIGIGPAKGKPGKGPMSEPDDEKTLAAEAVLKAFARKDAAALSRALEQHYECCQDAHASDDDDDEIKSEYDDEDDDF